MARRLLQENGRTAMAVVPKGHDTAAAEFSIGWGFVRAPLNIAVISLLVWLGANGAAAQTKASLAPSGWDAELRLPDIADENPDPQVVELALTAKVASVDVGGGKRVTAWTYNGGLPGPLIRARVGDRLVVRFKNELPQPTTVHWHGVRVPIEMDGVPGISQPDVEPGGVFTYDFVLRDPGLYWYHPHVMSAAQVGFGLYGALLVEDPADPVGVPDQLTIVLSDIGFDRHGTLEAADSGGPAGMVFGREGAYLLVNGKVHPTLRARAGALQRWRIVNAAKSRFFFLDLDGQPFTIIGSDGGFIEKPITDTALLVTPGERVDVIVAPTGKPNSSLILRALLYNRGYGSVEYRSVEEVMTIAFTAEPPIAKAAIPAVSRVITPPKPDGATPVEFVLTLPPAKPDGTSEFLVNGVPFWKAKPYLAKLGETQLWIIRNDSKWDHPFHLHGFFFMAVDDKGAPLRPMAWKDTLNVPMESTARFLVTFDERPGEWMFHCHILDHADGGLMGTVKVGDAPTTTHVHPKKGG
jgi:FtsP/CotA-like multicopper oxidase with cupredoxin domain